MCVFLLYYTSDIHAVKTVKESGCDSGVMYWGFFLFVCLFDI